MQIKEVEKELKMSAHTIRYYEKMNLIVPDRDENGYRNYSEADLQVLKKIQFLRFLDIPIEEISKIMNDTVYFHAVLDEHLASLDSQITSLKEIREICQELKEKEIPVLDTLAEKQLTKIQPAKNSFLDSKMKEVHSFFEPAKTIILGKRVDRPALVKKMIAWSLIYFYIMLVISCFIGGIGTLWVSFIFILPIAFFIMKPQDYIELTDEAIYVCQEKYNSAQTMYWAVLTRNERKYNHRYEWSNLKYVSVQLQKSRISVRLGLYYVYRLDFVFHFDDDETYKAYGNNNREQLRTSYEILKMKEIPIDASDEICEYFVQKDLSLYDYFENIYHLNYPSK